MAKNYGAKDYIGDIIRGIGSGISGKSTVPMYQAQAAGMPESAGVSPEIFQALLSGQKAESKIGTQEDLMRQKYGYMEDLQQKQFERQAELEAKRADAKKKYYQYVQNYGGAKDPATKFKYDFLMRMGMNPAFQFEAIDIDSLSNQLDQLAKGIVNVGSKPAGDKPKKTTEGAGTNLGDVFK